VDQLHEIIAGTELPDIPAVTTYRAEPLPEASSSEIVALLEYLDAREGKQDVFQIAGDTNSEFGRMINVVKAAEILNLVDTPKSMVVLEPDGKRFVNASSEQRRAIWREQLLKLRLFREVHQVLNNQPRHETDKDFVLETIIMQLPHENYETVFHTLIQWARFGELFSYDENEEKISLE
jgi:NitT/TauT family transport system ATP-binding protein